MSLTFRRIIIIALPTVALLAFITVHFHAKKQSASSAVISKTQNGAPLPSAAIEVAGVNGNSLKSTSSGKSQTSGLITSPQTTQNGLPGTDGVPAAGAKTEPTPTCFIVAYHHKPLPGHSDDESCSHHKNLIRLKHANVNSASVCMRVNGVPVKFERVAGRSDEVVIGGVAGPHAAITARYCVGHVTCNEDCTIPKDEFMDALGGGTESDVTLAANAQWEAEDAKAAAADSKLNQDLKKELSEFDEPAPAGNEEKGARKPFADWISENETPTCEKQERNVASISRRN